MLDRHRPPNPWGLDRLGGGAGELVLVGTGGGGRAGHSLNVAGWSPPQLHQWGGEVGQHDGTGLLLPLLGPVGFWHL